MRSLLLLVLLLPLIGQEHLRPEEVPALPQGRYVFAEFTAYCGGPCKVCQTTGVTANGTKCSAVPYNLAADSSLKMGTVIYIQPGLGVLDGARKDASDRFFTVDDRGGLVESEARERGVLRIDLRVKQHWWAVKFGRRYLPVYVVTGK